MEPEVSNSSFLDFLTRKKAEALNKIMNEVMED